jgi:hypothetical protein
MASTAFGNKKRPSGKAYRDGVIGEILDDIYSDVEEAFVTAEAATTAAAATATGAVAKSTYDAHTVLAATADNTPAAVTLAAKTLLGRGASGNIVALPTAITLDGTPPAIDDTELVTVPTTLAIGRNVFGCADIATEAPNGAILEVKVETAPASGVYKVVAKVAHPAGIAAAFTDSFSFWVPPGCRYKFAKTVAGASSVAFSTDGYNFTDV